MLGKCVLCLTDNVELQCSHFIPAGVYRRLRDEKAQNPNPWTLTENGAVQTSRQPKTPLLCKQCEGLFSKEGEDWIFRNGRQKDNGFPLLKVLKSKRPDVSSVHSPTKIYYTDHIPEINTQALTYFATSMFWRGSVHNWNDNGTIPVPLGPYQERFRRYLLGDEVFPRNCTLWVVVREGGSVERLTYQPMGKKDGGVHTFKFPMPGFGFTLMIGRALPLQIREKCVVNGPGKPIFVTSIIENILEKDATQMLQQSQHRRYRS
jgi:hypothetical protein